MKISSDTLTLLAGSCRSLCLLRLGRETLDHQGIEVFPSLLPSVEASSVASSWEDLDAEDEGVGRPSFSSLRYLIWPGVPSSIEMIILKQCPKIKLNSYSFSKSKEQWDPSTWVMDPLNPMTPLDLPFTVNCPESSHLLSEVRSKGEGPSRLDSYDKEGTSKDSCHKHILAKQRCGLQDFLSIAERFRQAYISQAQRMVERKAKAEAAAFRRKLRSSVALRAEEQWLDEI